MQHRRPIAYAVDALEDVGQGGTPEPYAYAIAIGVPGANVSGHNDAGLVAFLAALDGGNVASFVTQDSPGIPGGAESGDRFGAAVDTVRVGSTTRLVVGAPLEDVGSAKDAGSVQLFSGNGTTLTPGASLSQNTAGVGGAAENGDRFGEQLAFAAPGLGDSKTRLAVGVPREDGAAADTGAVQVFPVTDLDGETSYAQDTPGVPGAAEAGDRFGSALAVVAGNAERVLLVGVPSDVSNNKGMVDVIPFGDGTPRYWAPGINGVPAAGTAARFGGALASSGR